jgi:hypothetical protein
VRIVEQVQLAPWVRARLWRVNDWPAELGAMWAEVEAAKAPDTARKMWELGCAFEHCVPDRGRALAVLIDACRWGHPEARERALVLAENLRARVTVAELSLANKDHARAARAYIDAGLLELAIEPLNKLVDAEASVLLAIAKGVKIDAEQEIANALAKANAQHYLHAARIARAALPEKATSVVHAAVRACPNDRAIESLLVEDLLQRDAVTELLDHYRASFVAAKTRREYVERMRGAAIELIARDLQRGLALRLLRLALETSYDELLPEVASHLAAWEILVAHAREQKSLLELVPLILKALRAPLSQDDALYLARLGLEIAWTESRDAIAAQPYAATVLDFVPDHPLAVAFVRDANLDPDAPPPADMPSLPVVRISTPIPKVQGTGRMPVIKATPPPVPYADDKPVQRSTPPQSQFRTTSRLALLNPPPPRTTTLRRDVSPIPAAPRPRSATVDRAPRIVVPIDVTIELANGSFFTTVLRDMSTSGAFVVTKRKLEIGATLGLELRLPTKDALDQQVTHQANAKIARQTDIGYGIQFVDPAPILVEAIVAVTDRPAG